MSSKFYIPCPFNPFCCSAKSTAICRWGLSSDVLWHKIINSLILFCYRYLPEGLTAATLQVSILEHFTFAVRSCVQDHQVQVNLVTSISILPCWLSLKFKNMNDQMQKLIDYCTCLWECMFQHPEAEFWIFEELLLSLPGIPHIQPRKGLWEQEYVLICK